MKSTWIIPLTLIVCAMTVLYVVFVQTLSVQTVVIGIIVSAFVLFLSQSFFLKTSIFTLTMPSLYCFLFYGYLICQIFKGSHSSLIGIFDKSTNVQLIRYQTVLKSDALKCMLANAITLTPGTVTADIKGDTLEVLKLCRASEHDPAASLKKMEVLLVRMERNKR